MTIQQIPSIWDNIAGGLSSGQSGFNQQQAINKQDEQLRFQNLMGLFNSGGVNSGDLNASSTIKDMGVTVQPNQAELRRRATTGPGLDLSGAVSAAGGGITPPGTIVAPPSTTLTPDQRHVAGLPSMGELSGDQSVQRINSIKARIAQGDTTLKDEEWELAGMKSPDQRKVDKLKAFDPIIEQKAKNFVDGIFAQHGGRLSAQSASVAAEQAYQMYIKERQSSRLGVLTPEQQSYARAYFNTAVMDRLHDQRAQDIQELSAQNGKMSEHDRLYTELQSTAKMHSDAMEALTKGPGGAMFATKSPEEIAKMGPAFASVAREYQEHKSILRKLARAQQVVIAGGSRDAVMKILSEDDTGTAKSGSTGNVNLVEDLSPEQLSGAVQQLKALPADKRKAYLKANKDKLSAGDQVKMKQRFPGEWE